jgi:hypothetical protein
LGIVANREPAGYRLTAIDQQPINIERITLTDAIPVAKRAVTLIYNPSQGIANSDAFFFRPVVVCRRRNR